jgi:hypothetical protein
VSDAGASLKTGDVVYRVVEYDSPDENTPHTWKIESRAVKQASSRQVTLVRLFTGLSRQRFAPDDLGRLFFATPGQAVEAFAGHQRGEIDSLDRRRREAERALAWAYGQGAMVPT